MKCGCASRRYSTPRRTSRRRNSNWPHSGADRIARAGLHQVLDDLRQLEDGNLQLFRRSLHQRGRRGHQQQGPGDYQAVLRGEVVRHALEPADPGPEPGVGGGGAEHRRATRDRQRPEGRVSRVLHLKPEEPSSNSGPEWPARHTHPSLLGRCRRYLTEFPSVTFPRRPPHGWRMGPIDSGLPPDSRYRRLCN